MGYILANLTLESAVSALKLTLEWISALCVFVGLVWTAWLAIRRLRSFDPLVLAQLRVAFGSWLVLALEFQLASDIVATTVAPSFEELAMLAIVATIRTLLNYFLQKDLETVAHDTTNRPGKGLATDER